MVLMTIVSSSRTCSASPGFLLFGMGVGKGQRGARRHIMRVRSFCVPDKIEKLGKDSGVGGWRLYIHSGQFVQIWARHVYFPDIV
jgi:hypothetical protein